jgi:hypothetical protein
MWSPPNKAETNTTGGPRAADGVRDVNAVAGLDVADLGFHAGGIVPLRVRAEVRNVVLHRWEVLRIVTGSTAQRAGFTMQVRGLLSSI